MIRAALQRPGRLRMRLTVVAAASALFALIVLAVLVLPSLQHNLEQSRVASLRSGVLAVPPASSLHAVRGRSERERPAEPRGARSGSAGSASSPSTDFEIRHIADSSRRARRSPMRELVKESAALHRDAIGGREPAQRAHRGADVLRVQPGRRRRRAGRGAAARRAAAGRRRRAAPPARRRAGLRGRPAGRRAGGRAAGAAARAPARGRRSHRAWLLRRADRRPLARRDRRPRALAGRDAHAPRGARALARGLHRQRLARVADAADGARRVPRAAHGGRAQRGGAQRVPRGHG